MAVQATHVLTLMPLLPAMMLLGLGLATPALASLGLLTLRALAKVVATVLARDTQNGQSVPKETHLMNHWIVCKIVVSLKNNVYASLI